VIEIGKRHPFGFARAEAQESSPFAKPEVNSWLADAMASIALFGTPGAIPAPGTTYIIDYKAHAIILTNFYQGVSH
jgi:hypothetical protein